MSIAAKTRRKDGFASVMWIVAVLGLSCLFGCGPAGESAMDAGDGTLRVAVSIPPEAWLVERIGGDAVETVTILTPGQSPATYQPSDAQVSEVMRCGAYFLVGVPFEKGQWARTLTTMKPDIRLVNLAESIPHRRFNVGEGASEGEDAGEHDEEACGTCEACAGHEEERADDSETTEAHEAIDHAHGHALCDHKHDGEDPHVWLAPGTLKIMALNIEAALDQDGP